LLHTYCRVGLYRLLIAMVPPCHPFRCRLLEPQMQCLCHASFFGGGGISTSKKLTIFPLNGCQIACSKSFFRPGQIYYGNFLLMEINRGNYSSLSNQKDENLRLKCTKIRLAVGLHPNPLGSLCASPNLLAAMRGPTSKRGEGKGRRGLLMK